MKTNEEITKEIKDYFTPLFSYSTFEIRGDGIIRMYGEFSSGGEKYKCAYEFTLEQLQMIKFPIKDALNYIKEKLQIPNEK